MASAWRALDAGTVLHGTYEIVRPIGKGGMGDVYEARHTRLPGRFAIKVLTGVVGRGGANEFLRFRREAEVASALRHPNIVQVIDFNHMDDGSPYIVMELLDGYSLAADLDRVGHFSPGRALHIVAQIAAGLAAAHGKGIVHRDLKPQNVLFIPLCGTEGDFVKIVDFGISKVKTAVTLTDEARLMGTPQYMSPEQARSRPDEVDGSTDQFALAAMTYEMLSGRLAFHADSVPATLLKITNEDPPPLAEVPPPMGPAIEAVLHKAMAKEKESRFASILEFSDALALAISGVVKGERAGFATGRSSPRVDAGASTVQAAPARQPADGAKKPRRARLAGVAGAAVLALAAAGWTLRLSPEPIAAAPAPASAVVASAAPAPRDAGGAARLAASPQSDPVAQAPVPVAHATPALVARKRARGSAARAPANSALTPTRAAGRHEPKTGPKWSEGNEVKPPASPGDIIINEL